MATVINDEVKNNIPQKYENNTSLENQNTGKTPWKSFFTDPYLQDIIEVALKNNQELLKTYQEIEIAKSNVIAKKGKLSPFVGAGGSVGVRKPGRFTSEGAGDASTNIDENKPVPDPLMNFEGGFSASWEIDIWKKLRTEKEAAVAHYLSTVEGKNFILSSLISEIANNYYELLALDNQLDIIHQYIKLNEQALIITKVQKEAAATTELAVKKFEAELAKSKAQEFLVNQKITEKENTINALMGRFPQKIIRNKENFLNIIPQNVYTGLPSELLQNRPDVRQAEFELKSAQLDVQVARKEFYPSLGISASLGLEAFKPDYLVKLPESVAYNMMGEIAGPLINKSAIKANFKTADARQIQALYEYDKTIINSYLQVINLLSKIKNLDQYYGLKSQETQALEKSIDVANALFKNSRADYLEVLLNNRDLLDAKLELLEAKNQQLGTIVDLYKSLGGGWQ